MNFAHVLIPRILLRSMIYPELLTSFYNSINIATIVQFLLIQPRTADYTQLMADSSIINWRTTDQGKPMMSKYV